MLQILRRIWLIWLETVKEQTTIITYKKLFTKSSCNSSRKSMKCSSKFCKILHRMYEICKVHQAGLSARVIDVFLSACLDAVTWSIINMSECGLSYFFSNICMGSGCIVFHAFKDLSSLSTSAVQYSSTCQVVACHAAVRTCTRFDCDWRMEK